MSNPVDNLVIDLEDAASNDPTLANSPTLANWLRRIAAVVKCLDSKLVETSQSRGGAQGPAVPPVAPVGSGGAPSA